MILEPKKITVNPTFVPDTRNCVTVALLINTNFKILDTQIINCQMLDFIDNKSCHEYKNSFLFNVNGMARHFYFTDRKYKLSLNIM